MTALPRQYNAIVHNDDAAVLSAELRGAARAAAASEHGNRLKSERKKKERKNVVDETVGAAS